MTLSLYDIERLCTRAPGGIRDLGLIDPRDVSTLDPLTFLPGKRMYLYQQDRFSGRLVRKTDDSARAGDVISYTLTAFVKGIRLDMDRLAQALLNRRVHVLVTYTGGEQVLLLNMRLLHSHDSGERISSKNGYSLTGNTRSHRLQLLLNATLNVPTICTGGEEPSPGSDVMIVEISTEDPTYTYSVPTGKLLDAIYIKSNEDQVVDVGFSSGSSEIVSALPMSAEQYALTGSLALYAGTTTPIYFSGLQGLNTIKLWLL